MPLLFQKELDLGVEVGVWEITESENYFQERLSLVEVEQAQLSQIKGYRRVEWLAARHLLHVMSGRNIRGACLKDDFGKPYLENSTVHISMSHTHGLAAVIAGQPAVGIDIQWKVDKIMRIQQKFVNDQERVQLIDLNVSTLHILWGAKECLYKAYGRKRLDFRKHIHIQHLDPKPEKGYFKGVINLENQALLEFDLQYEWLYEKVCLVCAVETPVDPRE